MKGGSRPQTQMNSFRDVVDECGLRDLPYEGHEFAFDNGQAVEDNRQCRLDRAMVSRTWTDRFPYAKLIHLDREWSDHAPIKVILHRRSSSGSDAPKRFRFEQIWVGQDGCEDAVIRGWGQQDSDLLECINQCARELQKWKGVNIGKILRDLRKKRERLRRLNEGGRSSREVQERRKVVKEIAELMKQEETFWRQRSRAMWLKDGDKNTSFFHRRATQRKEKNHIAKIVTDDGQIKTTNTEIAACVVDYFKGLFKSSRPVGYSQLLVGIEGRVTEEMNAGLREHYRVEEILEALNQMHPLKAPGIDGMNGLFYQTYWHIIGPAVV
ncbi:uncharacterized protein LOC141595441 [Silene latifolia]|uniref:uncharacterized protein LOC141595441 n=1 Tax=Silene latifolia TaxID=37657 RepID=UPI003D77CBD4